MNGLLLLKSLRAIPRYKRVPVVVMSALDSERHLVEGIRTGADAYFTKPLSVRVLSTRVESLIARDVG